jgi:hypothetical protein
MSPRKRSVDDLDDIDDQDGVLEDQKREDSDLKLQPRSADELDLGGTDDDVESSERRS